MRMIVKLNHRLTIWLFIWLMILTAINSAFASSFYTSATRIGKQDGLPETTIFSLTTDRQGFLWLGAPNSLIRYDGYEFKQFSQNNQGNYHLHVSGAGNLFVDSQNRLWIGAWGDGLAVYDQSMQLINHFRHNANDATSLPNDKVQVIFEDDKGDIWVGTNGGGLAVYEPRHNKFLRYMHNANNDRSLSHNRVWSISQNKPGILWVATSNGLNRLDLNVTNRANATFERFYPDENVANSLNFSLIRSLYSDKSGRLWVGTQGDFGWFDVESGHFHMIELPNPMGSTIVNRIREDHQGNILIATQHGLYHYLPEKQQLSPWATNDGVQLFAQRDIRDVMIDDSGLLWLTTRYAGLIKIDMSSSSIQPFANYVVDNTDFAINRVYSGLNDKNNRLWLTSATGLLYKDPNDRVFSRYSLPEVIAGKNITAIAYKDQQLWLGGHFGLYSLHTQSGRVISQNHLLEKVKTKQIHSLLVDRNNNLWIGTVHEGLIKYSQNQKINHYIHQRHNQNSISGNTIITLIEDNLGHIWIGTSSSGLNRLDPQTDSFIRYQQPQGLRSNVINDIYQSHDGNIWLATSKSLTKFDFLTGSFSDYGVESGLGISNIMAVIEDDNQVLWVSDSNGIGRWQPQEQRFKYFNRRSFIGDNQFLPGVAVKTADGKLYFGGTSGVNQVLPNQVRESTFIPKVAITNISIDDNPLLYSQIPRDGGLTLDFRHKHIQIEFAALDFQQANKNKYRFMLAGFDEDWRKATNHRQINYTTLAPGEYQLKVLASSTGEVWGDDPLILPIEVLPPWWRMLWFKIVVLIFCLFLGWHYYNYRQRQMRLNAAKLEQQINLRTSELDESNRALASTINRLNESQSELVEQQKMASLGQMVAGIAHEVNTPLGLGITASTVLKQRINELKQLYYDKKLKPMHLNKFLEEGTQNSEIIFRNLERAANLIHGFKQVAVDQSSEDDRLFKVTEMLEEIMVTLSPTLRDSDHILTYQCAPDLQIYSKPGPLSQILFNLINNSLNHAFNEMEEGLMTIDVSIEAGHVKLVYRDNGCGLDESTQKQIYEPFMTTKRHEGRTGLGMHLVYNLVNRGLGGSIKLKSAPYSGVEYTIVFPADRRAMAEKVNQKNESAEVEEKTEEPSC